MTKPVGIIGAGAWGTALAQAVALGENKVLLWAKEEKVCKEINKNKTNSTYLKGATLAETVEATTDIDAVMQNCSLIFIACPSQYYTEILGLLLAKVTPEHQFVICSKGLRESDGALMSDILQEIIPAECAIGVLAGPAFAIELSAGKPCMLSCSSKSPQLIEAVNKALNAPSLRIYHNEDIIGAQVGGALKNVIAIAAGIAYEMELGESVQAAIICRGLREIERYALAFGAQAESIYGLGGLGDVVLTAHSVKSRNYRFGRQIGKGLTAKEALEEVDGYVEGLNTARIVTANAFSQGIDLAIISAIDGIIHGDISAEKAVQYLLQRPRTHERKA